MAQQNEYIPIDQNVSILTKLGQSFIASHCIFPTDK